MKRLVPAHPISPQLTEEEVNINAAAIAEAVDAMEERRQSLGDRAAFDPNDPETGKAFKRIWDVAFIPDYNPTDQENILHRLHTHHPQTVKRMRNIGQISEPLMELAYAQKAIDAARAIKDTSLVTRLEKIDGTIKRRPWRSRWVAEAPPNEEEQAAEKLYVEQTALLEQITKEFPYPTYKLLATAEASMVGALQHHPDRRFYEEGHLIIEAGALPMTAINLAMQSKERHIYCTIRDHESFEAASTLIHELERVGVIPKRSIKLLELDALSSDLKALDICDEAGKPVRFHYATITQLVQPKRNVDCIARKLINDLGIDTIVTRSAHHMALLLYEPVDDLSLHRGLKRRITAVPEARTITGDDVGRYDVVAHHNYQCYNTSNLHSRDPIDPCTAYGQLLSSGLFTRFASKDTVSAMRQRSF